MDANNAEEAQQHVRQIQCQKTCLIFLIVFFVFCLLSGDLFLILFSFFLLMSVSSSVQRQVQDQQEFQNNMVAGEVRIVPSDPRMVGANEPAAGAPQAYGQNYMVLQFSDGQTYHVPLAGAQAAPSMQSPQLQTVDITDRLTGAVTRTTATTAIPILTHDAPPTQQPQPHPSVPGQSGAAALPTTWREDYEAAKLRDGAEDEAAALYGSGVAYGPRPDPEDVSTGEATCVEVHDSPLAGRPGATREAASDIDEPHKPHKPQSGTKDEDC